MKIYLVGGAVRDKLMGLPIQERDWVVVGGTINDMLQRGYRQVGKEFPVFLHPKTNEEYALARMERKISPGYKGFTFDTSPDVTLEDDLKRRDLTINAIAQTTQGDIVDPYHGQADIKQKLLRHVSPAFAEDPVRILRVGRFLARFASVGFKVAPETLHLMKQMVQAGEVNALVAERVWKELERALGEPNPEQFFIVLAECGGLPILFPHLTMNGPGIKALISASHLTDEAKIRFAALLYALPEDQSDKKNAKKEITDLCHRYRIPNAYRELAQLTARHHQEIIGANTLAAENLLDLFYACDIYRRGERFHHLLITCQSIAQSLNQHFDVAWLTECAKAIQSVDIKALVAQNLTGPELAKTLRQERLQKLVEWLRKSSGLL